MIPKTYLIGVTGVIKENLYQYLKDSGQEEFIETYESALADGISEGEALVSFYAKLCYKSLVLGHNANVTKIRDIEDNLKGIVKTGHGSVFEHCYLNFITTNVSRVATHEIVRHRIGTSFCLAGDVEVWSGSKVTNEWDGIKKKWNMQQLHKWSLDTKRKGRIKLMLVRCWDGDKFVPAHIKSVTYSGKKEVYKTELSGGKEISSSIDHRFLTKDGWKPLSQLKVGDQIATNGIELYKTKEWLEQKYTIERLSQKEIAKLAGVSHHTIRTWIRKNGLTDIKRSHFPKNHKPWNKDNGGYENRKLTPTEKEIISQRMKAEGNHRWKGDKASPNAGRLRANRKFPTEPCEICNNPNGHRHHKDRNTLNNVRSNIEFLCASCHRKLHHIEDGSSTTLTVHWMDITSITHVGVQDTFDLEINHPSHNFVANGIVTHNSQTSGRYVSIDELDLVLPPILERSLKVESLRQTIEDGLKELRKELITDDMPFDMKKKLTSAIRRLAPNGQTNEIGWGCNVRSLRHMIELRTSRHAEWEIRVIFDEVARIIEEKWPLMLWVPEGKGTKELVDGLWEYTGLQITGVSK